MNYHQMSRVLRKPAFCICENKGADPLHDCLEADHSFVFATRIVQSLYFLNLKFQASSHLLWLYSLVCVGTGQKTRKPVFSQRGSNIIKYPLYLFFCVTLTCAELLSWNKSCLLGNGTWLTHMHTVMYKVKLSKLYVQKK